jgi:hypothetical protein
MMDARWGAAGGSEPWQVISTQGIDRPEIVTATGYEGGNPAAARDLIDCIQQDRQPKCSITEARGAIEMVLAAFESHVSGGPIAMPLKISDNALARL